MQGPPSWLRAWWPDGFQFFHEFSQLTTAARAEMEDLNTQAAGRLNPPNDALGTEGEAVDLEPHLQLIANLVAAGELGLYQATVQTEIENPPLLQIPTLNAEVDRTMALIARRSAPFLLAMNWK
jgi:hypothetical protein